MRVRPILKYRPGVERFEDKQLPSTGQLMAHSAHVDAIRAKAANASQAQANSTSAYQLFRITMPTPHNAQLNPPFNQVFVQATPPKTGGVYNVLSISVRNGTGQTLNANSGFQVRITGQKREFPVLTGDEVWRPGQVMVFYILSKKYYPLSPVTGGGFEFDMNGTRGVAIPGPSGIFLRIKYNPATFPNTLNWIVAHGPGSKGHTLGLPDTSIWEITSAKNPMIPL